MISPHSFGSGIAAYRTESASTRQLAPSSSQRAPGWSGSRRATSPETRPSAAPPGPVMRSPKSARWSRVGREHDRTESAAHESDRAERERPDSELGILGSRRTLLRCDLPSHRRIPVPLAREPLARSDASVRAILRASRHDSPRRRSAHALGPRVVPDTRAVPRQARRAAGRPARSARARPGLPLLLAGRPDDRRRRLPGRAPRRSRAAREAGARRSAGARTVDGAARRVAGLGRGARAQPPARAGARRRARRISAARLRAGSVRPRRSDAADLRGLRLRRGGAVARRRCRRGGNGVRLGGT